MHFSTLQRVKILERHTYRSFFCVYFTTTRYSFGSRQTF